MWFKIDFNAYCQDGVMLHMNTRILTTFYSAAVNSCVMHLLQFSLDDCSCTLVMGSTRVMSVVSASLESPFPDRPNEGSIRFNVELSPMASPFFEPGRPGEEAIELARLVERGLRQSHAIDQEALCVLAGRKVGFMLVIIALAVGSIVRAR
jgi:hypothetical protein